MASCVRTSGTLSSVTMVAALLALLTLLPDSQAVELNLFYPFGSKNNDSIMRPGDDTSSEAIYLSAPMVFYNKSYSTAYVNMNGLVSLGSRMSRYRSDLKIPIGMDTPFIAAFLADVDTTKVGRVYYRWSTDYEIRSRVGVDVRAYFSGYEDYMPLGVLIATWDRVGYYNAQSDKLNTFQLALSTDGVNAFSMFHYMDDGILWTQSQGKYAPNYVDPYPQAGFDGGRGGLSYTLTGSGDTGEFVTGSNINKIGAWIFQIGDLGTGNIRTVDFNTGDVTVFEVETMEKCLESAAVCHPQAECIDYRDSFCCKCVHPFYGNGIYCVEPRVAQVINGPVVGRVNGVSLGNQVTLHTYVVTTDGKSYSSMTKVPGSLAGPFQTLTSVGGIAGWMFAQLMNPLAKNGFMIAGSKFNRTSRVTYQSPEGRNYSLTVQQFFMGHHRPDHINMETHLDGTIPDIPFNAKITIDDYYENYKKTAPGVIKSFVTRIFRVQNVAHRYTWDNTITFEECGEEAAQSVGEVMRQFVTRHYAYLTDPSATGKNVVRFAMKSLISLHAGADPCAGAAELCHEKADCVPDGQSYKCICSTGYSGNGTYCTDVDECALNACGPNSVCYNVPGSFQCRCQAGYISEGRTCRAPNCNDADICGDNAQCAYDPDMRGYVCECLDEFSGDGYSCELVSGYDSCDECDRYAWCLDDEITGRKRCECREGYTGDGTRCSMIDNCRECDHYARCVFNEEISGHECICRHGYQGDGKTCKLQDCREDESLCDPDLGICWLNVTSNFSMCRCTYGSRGDGFRCELANCQDYNYCDRNAECVPDGGTYTCRCNDGFMGDGRRCSPEVRGCRETCDANARCVSDGDGRYYCRCERGYEGDGTTCRRPGEGCRETCDANARCARDRDGRYYCRCERGYEGDGITCRRPERDPGCRETCDVNAQCVEDSEGRYSCRCNAGYQGDGRRCSEANIDCDIVGNCDRNAECVYNPDAEAYQCRCNRGYEGNGLTCRRRVRDIRDCRREPRLCSPNAVCTPGSEEAYVCVCRSGYTGDGAYCEAVSREGNYLIYAQGNKIMRISADENSRENGQIIANEPGMLAVGVKIDCQEGDIYWTDAANGVIKRSKLNGTDMENVVNGMKSPEGIAIDFVARNMFFTDSEMDSLMVAKLDGSDVKTLVNTDMVNPRAVALDINRGTIYWTDWNRNRPQIERISMDGSERDILVSDDISLPNGLTFDPYSRNLCWGDAGTKKIECIRSDGRSRRVIYEKRYMYPFDITILNNVIYWTDWRMREIPNVSQNGGEENEPLSPALGGHGRVYGIAAMKDRCPQMRNSCGVNNGGCKYLCLPTARGGRTCGCPDGMDPRVCQ